MLDFMASIVLATVGTFITLTLLQKAGLGAALAFIAAQVAFVALFNRLRR